MSRKVPDQYEIIEKLGEGAFGVVYKAMKRGLDKPIALKVVDIEKAAYNLERPKKEVVAELDKEVKILSDLSSGCAYYFVLCYYGYFYDEDQDLYFIETELVNGSDMFDFVFNRSDISQDMKYYYLLLLAKDIAIGLKYIHEKGYIHNDIKLENILVDENTKEPRIVYTPVIIDLGLACEMKAGQCRMEGGTVGYMPREYYVYRNLRLPASDMFALGVTLYIGAVGEYPYSEYDDEAMVELSREQKDYPRIDTSNQLLNKITNGLLQRNPQDRLTPDQIIDILSDVESLRPR